MSIPRWVRTEDLDSATWYAPDVRHGQGDVLRAAADAHRRALTGTPRHRVAAILAELRARTIPRTENAVEARTRFALLVGDVARLGWPEDILADAARAYSAAPGPRHFPMSAGELRPFVDPLLIRRQRRAWRLLEMAKASDEAFDPATRCTPEQTAQILADLAAERAAKAGEARA
jgi:hypothetical protein